MPSEMPQMMSSWPSSSSSYNVTLPKTAEDGSGCDELLEERLRADGMRGLASSRSPPSAALSRRGRSATRSGPDSTISISSPNASACSAVDPSFGRCGIFEKEDAPYRCEGNAGGITSPESVVSDDGAYEGGGLYNIFQGRNSQSTGWDLTQLQLVERRKPRANHNAHTVAEKRMRDSPGLRFKHGKLGRKGGLHGSWLQGRLLD
jgi:hypothetical protein